MITAIKAEFRKVWSIRSTYVVLGIVAALLIFFGFFISGWQLHAADLAKPNALAGDVTGAVGTVSIFIALIGVLLLTHEYRYNTITYSLTLSNSRSKVILAKILVMSALALVFTALVGTLSPLLGLWGATANHLHFSHQVIPYGTLVWHSLFFGWGYTMAGLLIATLVRNQIGSFITLFVVPGTLEGLLGLMLKQNTVYLPFTALRSVLGREQLPYPTTLSADRTALIFLAYLVGGWIIAWILFLRRDAN